MMNYSVLKIKYTQEICIVEIRLLLYTNFFELFHELGDCKSDYNEPGNAHFARTD